MVHSNQGDYVYLYKKMFPYLRPYLLRFIFAMILTVPIGALDGAIAWSLRPYMDVVTIKKSLEYAWYIPVAIVAFTAVQGILNYMAAYLNGWLSQKITNDIKSNLFSKLLNFDSSFFDKNTSGHIMTRFGGDPDSVTSGLLSNIRTLFTRIFSSLALIGVLLYNSWILAIIAVSVISLIIIPLAIVRKRIKRISEGMVISGGNLVSHYNETVAGNKILAVYNLANHQLNRFKASLQDIFYLNMKMTKLGGWIGPITHLIASIGVAIVIGFGSYLIMSGKLEMKAFVSFILALIMLYTPLKSIGNTALSTQASFLAMGRVLKLLEYEAEIKNSDNPVVLNQVKDSIRFENVWFEYEKSKPVLKDINFEVKIGETVALVGNSGGGKSTIINLIPRFYEVTEGRILIDAADIRNIELFSLRDKIAVVFQDNFLFGGTIKENILLGKLDATEEEINKAVEDAYLSEFIASLKDGINSQIGERGVLLSGGQKQRIAIARALLKNAPIVILDEATSALDNKSEAIVQKALDRLMENRTVFVIAHRLSTVQNATRIIVLDNGRILESGSHDELMQRADGAYKNLYHSQFKDKQASLETV